MCVVREILQKSEINILILGQRSIIVAPSCVVSRVVKNSLSAEFLAFLPGITLGRLGGLGQLGFISRDLVHGITRNDFSFSARSPYVASPLGKGILSPTNRWDGILYDASETRL